MIELFTRVSKTRRVSSAIFKKKGTHDVLGGEEVKMLEIN